MFLLYRKVSHLHACTYPLFPGLMNLSLIKFFTKFIIVIKFSLTGSCFLPQYRHYGYHHSTLETEQSLSQ